MDIKVGLDAIKKASQELSNWGKWGKEDQIGTLNYVTKDNIVNAAKFCKNNERNLITFSGFNKENSLSNT